jgi:hypothetical protein
VEGERRGAFPHTEGTEGTEEVKAFKGSA